MSIKTKLAMILEAKGAKKAAAEIDTVDGSVKKLDSSARKSGSSTGRVAAGWKKLGVAAKTAAVGAGVLAVKLGKDAIDEYREAYKATKQTNAVIAATGGVAKVSANHVGDLAETISNKVGIDDEEIQNGANMLLTFKQIRNEAGKNNAVFDRATAAAIDLSASGFGSIKSASTMLGKALQDPQRGMTALTRVGVTFTDAQRKQVEGMIKAGDTLGAQKVILAEVESQVKGTAAAQADPIDRLTVAWANLLESAGTKFAPVFEKVVTFATGQLIPALVQIGGWLDRNRGVIGPLVGVLAAMVGVWKVFTVAMAIFNAVAAANPLVLWAVAIAGIVVLVVAAYRRFEGFRNVVNAVGNAFIWVGRQLVTAGKTIGSVISSVVGFVRNHWKTLLVILTGPIGIAVVLIRKHFSRIVEFAKALPGRVGRLLSGMWDGLKNGFKGAINWIIRKWNSFELSIGPISLPGLPDIPRVSFSTPNIPLLASGGEVRGHGSRWISGEAGPELGEVTPSGVRITPLGGDASGAEAVIHLSVNLDGRKVGEGIRRVALRDMLATSPT